MQNFGALPDDLSAAHAMILAERAARLEAEAQISNAMLEIERLKLLLAKARREQFGQGSERGRRLIDQLELQLSELEETAAEEEVAAEIAAAIVERPPRADGTRKPARRPLPAHLPRERILYAAPCTCPKCGGPVRKLGEDVTETLECMPRRWKVVEHVREKVSCRRCEAISQPPAPSHPIARGRAGPHLLALVLAAKYGQHLPLTRQSAIYAGEGIEIDVSTLADWVGAAAASLMPLVEAIRAHVFTADRIHADDTTVPVLAKEKTRIGRLWTYVRDDRPFAGPAPPAAAFFYSLDRSGQHPERHLVSFAGIMQADAYAGFNRLYEPGRQPGPILEAACWAHARRKLYELAAVAKSPIASEAVQRIDRLFAIERDIVGLAPEARLAERTERSSPILTKLEPWLRQQQQRLSRRSEVGRAIAYTTKRWTMLTRFLSDGRICLSNNAAERALRGVAVGRHNWTFAGSDRGGERAAAIYTLIETAKLNGIDPQAWLADVLARLPDHPAKRIDQLLPWHWAGSAKVSAAA
ncbi:MAG: IS66 family transposase [Chloroflexia bacterium]|nr:IS66 family transposase [Chloroflexia bacterium]